MTMKLTKFDPSAYIETSQGQLVYLEDAAAGGDPVEIADALGVVARARGMTEIAREAGAPRATLYKVLNTCGSPDLGALLKVLEALGARLSAAPAEGAQEEARKAS